MLKTFDGYDPHSPTLRASESVGDCMRGIIDEAVVTFWHDSSAPICSGDFVRLEVKYPEGVSFIVKRLRVSRWGTWWGECRDGFFEIGRLVKPLSIVKIVAFDDRPLTSSPPSWESYRKASPELKAHFDFLSHFVIQEWNTEGHRDGVRFPGLPHITINQPEIIGA